MIRIGIIGCGQAAQEFHIPALERLEDNKIVAVSDIEPAAAHRTAERLQNRSYDEPVKMVQQQCPEGCLVLTPPFVHRDGTELSLETGCHVLCESPAALNPDEIPAMIALAKELDLNLVFSLPHRYSPTLERLKALAEKHPDAVLSLRESYASFDTTPDRTRYFGPGLYERGVLLFDAALWMRGPVKEMEADRVPTGRGDGEDAASARLMHENGAVTFLHLNLNAGVEASRLLLHGKDVWAAVDQGEKCRIDYREGKGAVQREEFDRLDGLGYLAQMQAFLHCCDKQRPAPMAPETTLPAVELAREFAGL